MTGLLDGLRVLDFTIWRPGPYATQLLAELGAEVLKVEPPTGDPMRVYAGLFDGAERAEYVLAEGRRAYVHVARGRISIKGNPLEGGDALKTDAPRIVLEKGERAEVLLFDLP